MSQPSQSAKGSLFVNFIAGGLGGAAGVFFTCPLDVVQTRLQSSKVNIFQKTAGSILPQHQNNVYTGTFGLKVFRYMQYIVKNEGFLGLYKGILPNLVGIVPSRAIYFTVYTKTKSALTHRRSCTDSGIHMLSALTASWSVSTITNPIWFIKTKLQLNTNTSRKSVSTTIREVLRHEGIVGFYRGLSASYIGASETMIYFVLYEKLKVMLQKKDKRQSLSSIDIVIASFFAKMTASIAVYPHEVARTRLRQESLLSRDQRKYKGFMQTVLLVFKEEKWTGLYGGMGAHLMRQVPNTVIMFVAYEMIVDILSR